MNRKQGMTRREFIAAGAAVLATAGAGAAVHGAPRAGLRAAGKSRVALVKTEDRAAGIGKCLDILNANPFKGKSVFVKPNFNTSDAPPGSTHNDSLKAVLARARDMGAKSLAIGDRSGPEPTDQVLAKKGIPALAGAFDAAVLNLDELGEGGYVKVVPPGSHWKDGFLVARPVVEAECLVSLCCLKTHQFGGVITMSLKNSVGVVPRKGHAYMRELHSSPDQRKMIAEINCAYRPALVVLDGLEALVDGGPMTGTLKEAGVVLAGADRVAIDAVGTAILKELGSNDAVMKPAVFEQEQIARAAALGLGAASAADIVIETPGGASEAYAEKIRRILAA